MSLDMQQIATNTMQHLTWIFPSTSRQLGLPSPVPKPSPLPPLLASFLTLLSIKNMAGLCHMQSDMLTDMISASEFKSRKIKKFFLEVDNIVFGPAGAIMVTTLANGLDSESLFYFISAKLFTSIHAAPPQVKNPCMSQQRTWSFELQTEGLRIAGTRNSIKLK